MQEGQLTVEQYENKLKEKDLELESLREKIAGLENEASQGQNLKNLRSKEQQEVAKLKEQSEGILTKAKAMIFENTKVIKNQELQIEALGQQNESLKDVVQITKDLLEIRNLEVKQLENKIGAMEGKVRAEKERHDLMHKKLENMIRHNGELKREYEAQLCLFSALRERYSERELAKDVVDNLREDLKTERAIAAKQNLENGKAEEPQTKEVSTNEKTEEQKTLEENIKPESEQQPEQNETPKTAEEQNNKTPETAQAQNNEMPKTAEQNIEAPKTEEQNKEIPKTEEQNIETPKTEEQNNE